MIKLDFCMKWVGNALVFIGVILTSINIYPWGVILSGISSVMWGISAYINNNRALLTLEIGLVLLTIGGLLWAFLRI